MEFTPQSQLNTIKERFFGFLNGETNIVADEAFTNAISSYYEVFLRSDRVKKMVESGGSSDHDFREVFRQVNSRVRRTVDGWDFRRVMTIRPAGGQPPAANPWPGFRLAGCWAPAGRI
jgi:hypothetical protein